MKRIERTELGYLLNDFQHRLVCKNSIALLRHALLNLVHLGRITHKEKNEIEYFIDCILYKDIIKKVEEQQKKK